MTPLALRIERAPAQRARRFGRAPLAVKLAIAFLGLVALVLIVNGAVDTYLTYNQARRAALEVEGEKARGASERVGAFLSEIQTQLGWTAGAEWGYSKLEQQRYDFIRLLRQAPAITALSYIDGKGREQIAVSRLEPDAIASGKDFSADPRFTRAVAEKIWFGPVEFRRGSEPYMTIALAHVGKTPGVTVADVNLKLVWDVVSAIHVGSQGLAYIVDDHGRLIAHPDLSLVLRDSDFSKLPQVAEAMKGQGGSAAAAKSFDGAAVLTAFAIEPKTHWAVFVEQPLSEALAAAYATLARAAGLLGLGLLLAAVTGVALARALAAPIRVLQAGAERLGAGDLSQRLDIRTGDEIEALAGGFNRMAERLQESYENLEAKVEARTKDLNEALQQQTATADVLKAISGSVFDPQAVLETLINSATALSGSTNGMIWRFENGAMHSRAFARGEGRAEFVDYMKAHPQPPGRGSTVARVALTGDVQNIADVREDPDYSQELRRTVSTRATLGVPMKRGDALIGAIVMSKPEAGAYSALIVELTKTFADQAVIAIENARLFNETQEALERQTATAEILRVIASSPSDVQPVFDRIAASAKRLLGGVSAAVTRIIGDALHVGAFTPVDPATDAAVRNAYPRPLADFDGYERFLAGETFEYADLEAAAVPPSVRDLGRLRGYRAILGIPMMSAGAPIGGIHITREKAGRFSSKEIDLLRSFADQAVIAINNVKLFNETQESLAQQTATADVLKVISRSAFGLKTVLQALVDSAVRLCASDGVIYLRHGDEFRAEAVYGAESPGYDSKQRSPRRAGRDSVVGRVALSGDVEQIPDNLADPEFKVVDSQRMKMRSLLGVPLIRDGAVEGVFLLGRPEPGLFADRAVELVRTFADQAVIAIENVRLFEEVQARTRDVEESLAQQTATADVLKVISRSVFDLQTVFETLLTTAVKLVGGVGGAIALRDGDKLRFRAGASPQGFLGADFVGRLIEIDRSSAAGRAVETGLTQYIPDADADADFRVVASGSWGRSYLGVPLSRDGKAEGALTVIAERSHAFTPRHIELVQTFADQAVIAIENVRLFAEVQAKTQDLSESLEYQTAISNVLGVISRSPKEVQPVLDTIVATARVLCVAERAVVWGIENDQFRPIAFSGMDSSSIEKIADHRLPTGSESVAGQAASKRHAVQILDATIDTSVGEQQHMLARAGNIHTILAVPLMDDGVATGCLTLSRTVAQRFDDRQVGLLQTFAEQAVIAIKNVRLFEEVQARTRDVEESLAQQTATADVLKVISRSAFDLDAIFQTLVTTAVELCKAPSGTLCVRDGEVFRYRGMAGSDASPELQRYLQAHPLGEPTRATAAGRAILSRQAEQIEDVLKDEDYAVPFAANGSPNRSVLSVPLIGKADVLGAIVVARAEPGAFPARAVEILRTFADQAVIAIENSRLFDEVQARTRELEHSLADLRKAQDRLVQSEKLASLGQLTAGIAHEIKNPLNFVNNFASLSRELLEELREALLRLPDDARADADDLMGMIDSNLEKVAHHGKRADSIVKNMLLHSREGSGERTRVNVNAMIEEALNLGYHGARAEKPGFNVTIEKAFDAQAGEAELYLQEVTRVVLNLISNGFYATDKRRQAEGPGYAPTLTVSTRDLGHNVEIRIRDNGTGIPDEVRAKMFNPFFTTKPAGEGTGLGLSLSHDIVVKQHGGALDVETAPGAFTEFVITLPREEARA